MAAIYAFLNFLQPGVLWPELSALRPMLIASLAGILWGLAFGSAAHELRARYFRHPIFVWLCVFVVVQVVSVYYSGVSSMYEELNFWSVYLLFVVVSLLNVRDESTLRQFVWGMMLGTAVVVGYGLYAVATQSPSLAGGRAGAYGMYENHNDYTFAIIMVLPFAYLLRRGDGSRLAWLLLSALLVACVAGVALSLSRGGILALVLEAGLLLWMTLKGGRRIFAVVLLSVLGSVAVAWQFAAREANQQGVYSEADARNSRYELWRAARNMFVAHPVLGVGSRRFSEFSQDYGEISHDNRGKVAHNTYIEVLADTGLVGFTVFIMFLRGMLRATRGLGAQGAESRLVSDVRLATWISLVSIAFRALLDAKAYDWSFYVAATLAIVVDCLPRRAVESADVVAGPAASSAGAAVSRTLARPRVYGLRG